MDICPGALEFLVTPLVRAGRRHSPTGLSSTSSCRTTGRVTLPSEQSAAACAGWSSDAVVMTTTTPHSSSISILSTKPVVVVASIAVACYKLVTITTRLGLLQHDRADHDGMTGCARVPTSAERWREMRWRAASTAVAESGRSAARTARRLSVLRSLPRRPTFCIQLVASRRNVMLQNIFIHNDSNKYAAKVEKRRTDLLHVIYRVSQKSTFLFFE